MNFKEYELSIGNGYVPGDKRIKLQFPVKNSTRLVGYFLDAKTPNMVFIGEEKSRDIMQRFILANLLKYYRPTSVRVKLLSVTDNAIDKSSTVLPIAFAPQVSSVCTIGTTDEDVAYANMMVALRDLYDKDMMLVSEFIADKEDAQTFGESGCVKIPHTVVLMTDVLSYICKVNNIAKRDLLLTYLHKILECAGRLNYHIILSESDIPASSEEYITLDLFGYKFAMRSTPDASRYLIGTDIACTLPEGSNSFFTFVNGEFISHEVPEVTDEQFFEIVSKCSRCC